jgi:biotin--protein ligase
MFVVSFGLSNTDGVPRFAAVNLSRDAKNMNPAVVDALAADDKPRSDFLRACLLKLGLHVSPHEQALPSLSPIHISSMIPDGVKNVIAELEKENAITKEEEKELIKGQVDTFQLRQTSGAWSMANVTNAIEEAVPDTRAADADDDSDKIIDYEKIVKRLIAHEAEPPSAQDAPYFDHDAYFAALETYINADRRALYSNIQVGKYLMYGHVVTSTSTLLEKYVRPPQKSTNSSLLFTEIQLLHHTCQLARSSQPQLNFPAVAVVPMSGSLQLAV